MEEETLQSWRASSEPDPGHGPNRSPESWTCVTITPTALNPNLSPEPGHSPHPDLGERRVRVRVRVRIRVRVRVRVRVRIIL